MWDSKVSFAIFLGFLVICRPAVAQTPEPSLSAIATAARSAQIAHCRTDEFIAIILVQQLISIDFKGESSTYGLSDAATNKIEDQTSRQVDNILYSRPDEFPAICKILTRFIAQYPPGDFFVAISSIELALRMDLKSGSCLSRVLKAFRPTGYGMVAVRNAHELCMEDWKLGPACRRIRRDDFP